MKCIYPLLILTLLSGCGNKPVSTTVDERDRKIAELTARLDEQSDYIRHLNAKLSKRNALIQKAQQPILRTLSSNQGPDILQTWAYNFVEGYGETHGDGAFELCSDMAGDSPNLNAQYTKKDFPIKLVTACAIVLHGAEF